MSTRAASTKGCREDPTNSSLVVSSLAWKYPGEILIAETIMTSEGRSAAVDPSNFAAAT
jgi:hypothetical protein